MHQNNIDLNIKMRAIRLIKLMAIGCFSFMSMMLYGQDDCTLKLNQAQKLYEEGKIESVSPLLLPCLESGFNRENKISALRLMALVEIFEDNQEQAENYLLKILKTDPEYKYNEVIDPIEYIRLYKLINTDPVFSIGAHIGFNTVKPHLKQNYSSNDYYKSNDKYSSNGIGLQLGLIGIYHINKTFDLTFEPSYSSYSFTLDEDLQANSKLFNEEKISYIDFPVIGKYYFIDLKGISYFAEGGFCYGKYLSGTQNPTKTSNSNEQPPRTGSSIPTDELRKDYNASGIIGTGAKIKLNRSNMQISLRYKMGMLNLMKTENRMENIGETNSKFEFIDNDFSLNSISFHISYNYEFYSHKRKK